MYRTVLFISLISVVTILSSCHDHPLELEGKWSVKSVMLDTDESDDSNSILGLKAELESMVFQFKSDGLLLYSNFFRLGSHGKWELSKNQDSLFCRYQYERVNYMDNYKIVDLHDVLQLTSRDFDGVNSVQLEIHRSKW